MLLFERWFLRIELWSRILFFSRRINITFEKIIDLLKKFILQYLDMFSFILFGSNS